MRRCYYVFKSVIVFINSIDFIADLYFLKRIRAKMSFLRSAIPILSSLNDECELLRDSLELSSIMYLKFSPKTMEMALKQLKQEL